MFYKCKTKYFLYATYRTNKHNYKVKSNKNTAGPTSHLKGSSPLWNLKCLIRKLEWVNMVKYGH